METTETTPRGGPASGVVFRLLIAHGPTDAAAGDALVLDEGAVQMGRLAQPGTRCFVLEHAQVSRMHARVEPAPGGGYVLHDLGSHNGTLVNGLRVERHVLRDGDVVRVGSYLLLFQALTAEQCNLLLATERWPAAGLIGASAPMLAMRRAIARAATLIAPILITGESGVGKELVARALHEQSGRGGRFVPVNCAALPQALIESELFGHTRGAFTGATQAQAGLFEEAEGGTLLLDEIGDMPLELQAKLLRALATSEVRKVGTSRARRVDVKLIAATNVDLLAAVDAGRFRGDLYARLLADRIEVPPLRSRREDILPLAQHFLRRQGSDDALDIDCAEALLVHDWPFNVRELEHATPLLAKPGAPEQRLQELRARLRATVPASTGAAEPNRPAGAPLRRCPPDAQPNKGDLEAALAHFGGNIKRVAAFYVRDRRTIYRWCEEHGLDPERYR